MDFQSAITNSSFLESGEIGGETTLERLLGALPSEKKWKLHGPALERVSELDEGALESASIVITKSGDRFCKKALRFALRHIMLRYQTYKPWRTISAGDIVSEALGRLHHGELAVEGKVTFNSVFLRMMQSIETVISDTAKKEVRLAITQGGDCFYQKSLRFTLAHFVRMFSTTNPWRTVDAEDVLSEAIIRVIDGKPPVRGEFTPQSVLLCTMQSIRTVVSNTAKHEFRFWQAQFDADFERKNWAALHGKARGLHRLDLEDFVVALSHRLGQFQRVCLNGLLDGQKAAEVAQRENVSVNRVFEGNRIVRKVAIKVWEELFGNPPPRHHRRKSETPMADLGQLVEDIVERKEQREIVMDALNALFEEEALGLLPSGRREDPLMKEILGESDQEFLHDLKHFGYNRSNLDSAVERIKIKVDRSARSSVSVASSGEAHGLTPESSRFYPFLLIRDEPGCGKTMLFHTFASFHRSIRLKLLMDILSKVRPRVIAIHLDCDGDRLDRRHAQGCGIPGREGQVFEVEFKPGDCQRLGPARHEPTGNIRWFNSCIHVKWSKMFFPILENLEDTLIGVRMDHNSTDHGNPLLNLVLEIKGRCPKTPLRAYATKTKVWLDATPWSYPERAISKEVTHFLISTSGKITANCIRDDGGHAMALKKLLEAGLMVDIDLPFQGIEHTRIAFFVKRNAGGNRVMMPLFSHAQVPPLGGILLDLGLSTPQLLNPALGMSWDSDESLDMRLDPQAGSPSAAEIVNEWNEEDLARLFWEHAEEKWSRRITRRIAEARKKGPIATGRQLGEIIAEAIPRKAWPPKIHPATRCLMALRIEVNRKYENLEAVLPQALDGLKPGGRLVVISFHSGEGSIINQLCQAERDASGLLPQSGVNSKLRFKIITSILDRPWTFGCGALCEPNADVEDLRKEPFVTLLFGDSAQQEGSRGLTRCVLYAPCWALRLRRSSDSRN